MAIIIRNMQTHRAFTCAKEEWASLLDAARAHGWEEEGSKYDFEYQMDEYTDTHYDYLYNLWMIFYASREWHEWNGSYLEAKNQIVSESDAYFLMKALEKVEGVGSDLLAFLSEGSFRICDE